MEWLEYPDALALVPADAGHPVPQRISVLADVAELCTCIPIPPRLVEPEEGPPTRLHQWFGRIGRLFFTVECEAEVVITPSSVLIQTPFPTKPNDLGDWATLIELQALPKPFYVTRPLFVESRNTNPMVVVYRPDPQGWKAAIYKAASQVEAENLLAFLRQDEWNETCFIGEPEPTGKWAIVQGEEIILGTGSELNSALRVACEMSLRNTSTVLQVKDVSGANKRDTYVVTQGRVLQP